MKITISHDQASIDPSATYTDEQFEDVKSALETEYETAIKSEYPDAEIDFSGTDTTYSIRITDNDLNDNHQTEHHVQIICERVFETGNFWA